MTSRSPEGADDHKRQLELTQVTVQLQGKWRITTLRLPPDVLRTFQSAAHRDRKTAREGNNPEQCQKPRDITVTPNNGKRNRPSYLANFPPLNEFGESSDSVSETAKAAFTIAPHHQFPRIPCSSVPQRADKANIAPTKHPSQHVTAVVPTIAPPHSEKPKITYSESSRHRAFPGLGAASFTPNLVQIPVSTPDLVQPHSGLPWPVTQISALQETLSGSESNKTPRCNRCILHRRKCDGRQPRCGLCLERGAECVYNKAGITRAYLEKMQKGAEGFRQMSASNTAALMGANAEAEELRGRQGHASSRAPLQREFTRSHLAQFMEAGPRYSYANHVELIKTLDQGQAAPERAERLFDETTHLFEEFSRMEGNILDEWAREGYARLQLNWPERQSGGSDVTEGELSSLRRRVGLTDLRRRCGSQTDAVAKEAEGLASGGGHAG